MARVTIEDCKKRVKNRFELVLLCSTRARSISSGERAAIIQQDNEKPTVVALREIGNSAVDVEVLRSNTVFSYMKRKNTDQLLENEDHIHNHLSAQDLDDIVSNFSTESSMDDFNELNIEDSVDEMESFSDINEEEE